MTRHTINDVLASVQLVQKQPRTVNELAQLLGLQPESARRYLSVMEDEGLVTRSRQARAGVGCNPYVFTWVREGGQ